MRVHCHWVTKLPYMVLTALMCMAVPDVDVVVPETHSSESEFMYSEIVQLDDVNSANIVGANIVVQLDDVNSAINSLVQEKVDTTTLSGCIEYFKLLVQTSSYADGTRGQQAIVDGERALRRAVNSMSADLSTEYNASLTDLNTLKDVIVNNSMVIAGTLPLSLEYISSSIPVHTQTHTHTLVITLHCTCCYDEIKGNQDFKICSHANSLILSLSPSDLTKETHDKNFSIPLILDSFSPLGSLPDSLCGLLSISLSFFVCSSLL